MLWFTLEKALILCYGIQVHFDGADYFQLLKWCEIQAGNLQKKTICLPEKNPEPLSEGQLMLSSLLHNMLPWCLWHPVPQRLLHRSSSFQQCSGLHNQELMQICCFLLLWLQLPESELWHVQKPLSSPNPNPIPIIWSRSRRSGCH